MKTITKIGLSIALCSNLLYSADVEKELDAQAQSMKADIKTVTTKTLSEQAIDKYKKKKKEWDEKKSGFTLDAGAWLINWDQTSTARDMLTNKSDALIVDYNIDKSVAAVVKLNANYKLISGSLEYYTNNQTAKDNEEVSGLNAGLSIINMIPHISTEFRFTSANFKGSILAQESNGTVANEQPSSGTFETELDLFDFIVYPFNNYVGVGYRRYNYDFPHDAYLIRNSDNQGITRGLMNVEYDGSFYTVAIDNKRFVDDEINYNGIVYSIIAGVGKLTPKASGYEKYITDSDARFADIYGNDSD